jgi:hypothetical protein
MRLRSLDRCDDAIREERDVESKLLSREVDELFLLGRRQTGVLQCLCNRTIAQTMPAAAAPVDEDDECLPVGRQAQVTTEGSTRDDEPHRSWSHC